ncbi:MAG: hypothetical protein Kow0027_29720 [Saprospiraceae bacterium]|nr:hypothetical protein [Saprospirales bacterium]RME06371.1 MAG: hypothetical protein D6816_07810 [Bacteroidota bacterium]
MHPDSNHFATNPAIMKKLFPFLALLLIAAATTISTSSCNRGYGCPINEESHIQPDKKGRYPKSKTRSGLFPKDMKKKVKVN